MTTSIVSSLYSAKDLVAPYVSPIYDTVKYVGVASVPSIASAVAPIALGHSAWALAVVPPLWSVAKITRGYCLIKSEQISKIFTCTKAANQKVQQKRIEKGERLIQEGIAELKWKVPTAIACGVVGVVFQDIGEDMANEASQQIARSAQNGLYKCTEIGTSMTGEVIAHCTKIVS